MRLYHWSPTERRSAILSEGFVPGSLSTDEIWNPDYTCWAESPYAAWLLSGDMPRGRLIAEWSLYMTDTAWWEEAKTLPPLHYEQEYRLRWVLSPGEFWHVGTRVQAL